MKNIIKKYVDTKNSKILEIGAYDKPTFSKDESHIYFLDIQSKEELIADSTKKEKQSNAIVAVDYLVHSNDHEQYIQDKFDVIIADNVFEHVSNPIKWLKTLHDLLNEYGYIFLCIPEHAKCFDKFREHTTFAHIITDYIRDVPDLDPEHSVEVGILYDMNFIKEENLIHEKINFQRSLKDYHNPHYGVHCHVFSQRTFINKIMKPILMLGFFDLKIVDCQSNSKSSFIVILQKAVEKCSLTFDEFVSK